MSIGRTNGSMRTSMWLGLACVACAACGGEEAPSSADAGAPDAGATVMCEQPTWSLAAGPELEDHWELYDVHFPNADNGWAVGVRYDDEQTYSRGVITRYKDGAWSEDISPQVAGDWVLRSVHFPSAEQGWAVGSRILEGSADAGSACLVLHYANGAWTAHDLPYAEGSICKLTGVGFDGAERGWAVGARAESEYGMRRAALFEYTDGDWMELSVMDPPGPPTDYWMYYAVDANNGAAMATGIQRVDAEDCGGAEPIATLGPGTWTHNDLIPPCDSAGRGARHLKAVSIDANGNAWAVGEEYFLDEMEVVHVRGVAMQYLDGQWSLEQVTELTVGFTFEDVDIAADGTVWIVGEDRNTDKAVLLSNRSGTWAAEPVAAITHDYGVPHAVHFQSASSGWAVGTAATEIGTDTWQAFGLLLHYGCAEL